MTVKPKTKEQKKFAKRLDKVEKDIERSTRRLASMVHTMSNLQNVIKKKADDPSKIRKFIGRFSRKFRKGERRYEKEMNEIISISWETMNEAEEALNKVEYTLKDYKPENDEQKEQLRSSLSDMNSLRDSIENIKKILKKESTLKDFIMSHIGAGDTYLSQDFSQIQKDTKENDNDKIREDIEEIEKEIGTDRKAINNDLHCHDHLKDMMKVMQKTVFPLLITFSALTGCADPMGTDLEQIEEVTEDEKGEIEKEFNADSRMVQETFTLFEEKLETGKDSIDLDKFYDGERGSIREEHGQLSLQIDSARFRVNKGGIIVGEGEKGFLEGMDINSFLKQLKKALESISTVKVNITNGSEHPIVVHYANGDSINLSNNNHTLAPGDSGEFNLSEGISISDISGNEITDYAFSGKENNRGKASLEFTGSMIK